MVYGCVFCDSGGSDGDVVEISGGGGLTEVCVKNKVVDFLMVGAFV